MLRRSLLALPALLIVAGCALSPDYERPAQEVRGDWYRDAPSGETGRIAWSRAPGCSP